MGWCLLSTRSRHPDESTKTVIQPGGKCKAKEFNGLEVPPAATFRTWVWIIVVDTSECPSNSCTVLMSVPVCSKWVAKEWRRVCTDTCLAMPACATAFFSCRVGLSSNKW